MSAPAVEVGALAGRRTRGGRAAVAGRDRFGWLVEAYFRGHATIVYLWLYLPILIVVIFAFNATNQYVTDWKGVSLKWFSVALGDSVVRSALGNSTTVAFFNMILATTFGTMAALGLQRVGKRLRLVFDTLTYVSVIVPEIVIALSTRVFFSASFDVVNPVLAVAQGNPPKPAQFGFGVATIVAAHVLFNTSLVLLLVRARLSGMDRTHVEASYDLYATPWRTFRQITFPQLLPAIVAGALLSFTFSFDDYVITSFTSGPGSSTLPLFVFGQVRRGVTPETNAVAAMMLLLTLTILLAGQLLVARQSRRRGQATSMVGVIAEQGAV